MGDGTIAAESTIVHGGVYAAKLTAGASVDTYIYQSLTVTAGTDARIQTWTRGDGTYGGRYSVYDLTNSSNLINITATGITGTAYVRFRVSFAIPSNCTSLEVRLYCPGTDTGIAYYDDVSLKYE